MLINQLKDNDSLTFNSLLIQITHTIYFKFIFTKYSKLISKLQNKADNQNTIYDCLMPYSYLNIQNTLMPCKHV